MIVWVFYNHLLFFQPAPIGLAGFSMLKICSWCGRAMCFRLIILNIQGKRSCLVIDLRKDQVVLNGVVICTTQKLTEWIWFRRMTSSGKGLYSLGNCRLWLAAILLICQGISIKLRKRFVMESIFLDDICRNGMRREKRPEIVHDLRGSVQWTAQSAINR